MELRLAGTLERSCANGPGERFVVWVRGCSLRCPGCVNMELWEPRGGELVAVAELARRINGTAGLRGLTVSGGEPFEQAEALGELLDRLDKRLDTVIFTGYTWEEIQADNRKAAAAGRADLLVAGRYIQKLASEENPWAASSNQTVHALTGRIRADDYPACRVEAQISPAGEVVLTGFPPAGLNRQWSIK